jgi:cell division protein FtsW
MFFLSKVDYRFYKKFYWYIYAFSVGILLLVLVPGLGKTVNGATRWIQIPLLGQFQPSELTKIGLIIFFAGYLTDHKDKLKDPWKGFVLPILLLALPVLILYKIQNHLSVALVIMIVTFVMMLMAGCRVFHFFVTGCIGAGGIGAILAKSLLNTSTEGNSSFRIDRILTFLDPWSDATGTGYQMIQSLYAIGSGGLFGVGLGNSKQKYLYIPEPQNDFIFAIVAEELGFVGCAIIILLFAIFVWRGIVISMKAPDMFGSLLAIGITTLIGSQTIINIAVVTASIPTTGMALPFFSYRRNSTINITGIGRNIIKCLKGRLKSLDKKLTFGAVH